MVTPSVVIVGDVALHSEQLRGLVAGEWTGRAA